MRASEDCALWLEALHNDGMLSDQQYQYLRAQIPEDVHPLEWLSQQALVSAKDAQQIHEEQLLDWLSQTTGIPLLRIDPLQLDLKAVSNIIPTRFARHHQIVALSISNNKLSVACANPFRVREWHTELSTALSKTIELHLVRPKEIGMYLDTLYPLDRSIKRIANTDDNTSTFVSSPLLRLESNYEDTSATTLTNRLLRYALDNGASDIHLEPRETHTCMRLRVDGQLYHLINLPTYVAQVVNHRLKVLALMDTTEKRRPQDGHLRTAQDNGEILELRLSTLATAYGEKLVLRLLSPKMLKQESVALGMGKTTQQHCQGMLNKGRGLVLITGPTGSGKTTTLYNILHQLDSKTSNICTIEDPIEIVEPRFNQTQTRPDLGLDFAAGIRAMMRQDPDIIMVGEIRDSETAKAATQAALTGHQVFASMHTENSIGAIARLGDIGVPNYLLRATLTGVLHQRLLPRLCTYCKHKINLDADMRAQLAAHGARKAVPYYAARGCAQCRYSGINGRVGVFESLLINASLRSHINPHDTQDAFAKHAQDAKLWSPLQDSVIHLLEQGVIGAKTSLKLMREFDFYESVSSAS